MSFKRATISFVIWNAIDRLGSQDIQFIIFIILARILLSEESGLMVQILSEIIVYTSLSYIFKIPLFMELYHILKSLIKIQ